MVERSDADLLRAHVAGEADAFGELFRRHRDRLWAVALRTLGDREEAADALQDALLSAHRAAARFRGDSAVTTWLHRIVVNACLDRVRRRRTHQTVPLPDGTGGDRHPYTGVEPAAPAVDHDTVLVVQEALAQLPGDQRAAIVLVDLHGYPVSEAAEILEVAEGTVKSRCSRGRARLATLLGHLRTAKPGASAAGRSEVAAAPPASAPGNAAAKPGASAAGRSDVAAAPPASAPGNAASSGNRDASGSVSSGSAKSVEGGAR